MTFALLGLGGGEIILVLTLILILLGVRRLPDIAEGLRRGFEQLRKATGRAGDEMADQLQTKRSTEEQAHPFLMALTLILGVICVMLVLYEFYK